MAQFQLDEDQRQIQEMMARFAREELRARSREHDESGQLPPDLLQKTWELGIGAQSIPEAYGGFGQERSVLTGALLCEELAWGDLSLTMAALSPMLMMVPILEFGADEQKAEWLPKFCGDQFFHGTAALVEPRVTFDPFLLATNAKPADGGDFVLNGEKCMVPLAGDAEHIVVYARLEDPTELEYPRAFILDKDTPGLTVERREEYMGLRSLPLYRVTLEDCRVPEERRIGHKEGVDYDRIVNLSRAAASAMAVGVARASLEYALEYAKDRTAFGEPIASRQAIAFMLAEMAMEVDAMRLMAWRAAWRLDRNEDATRDAALAKRYCAEQAMRITDYGVQILGGHGYIREHPSELWFRNGRSFAVADGAALV